MKTGFLGRALAHSLMATSLVAASLLALMTGCVPHTTGSTEVGVRVNKLTGMEKQVYPPGGTYFFAPFITDWYTFSTQAQTLTMVADANSGDRAGKDDLEFKTRDGNDVAMDVTVIYRIIPDRAPFVLQRIASSDYELKERIVRPMARSITRDVLNELSSEDVYSGKKFQAAERAREVLDRAFTPYGLKCDNVVLADHRFHERYQKAINDKKVFDQQVNTYRSASENVVREWEAKLESTRGDVERLIATETGKVAQLRLSADAYYVSRQKEAEAILAEKTSRAQAAQKMNEALAGAGGRVMVKRKVAAALKGKRIVVLPGGEGGIGVQKLDVNALLKTYGLTEAMRDTPAAQP